MQDIWIKKIEMINFQSHQHTQIDFVKGTNALLGSSNSGKSAVIRAIKWCLLNIPNGTDFIRVGEKETTVRVWLSNDKMIERKKSRGNINQYGLYENGTLLGEYTGFGSSVPPEIVEAHGIVPIADDIYFQFSRQDDAPFLLSLPARKRADVLGNLEELRVIDKGLIELNDDLRLHSKSKKNLEREGKDLELQRETLRIEIDRMGGKIETLKNLKAGIESKMSLRLFLENQIRRIKEVQEKIKTLHTESEKSNRLLASWPNDLEKRIEKSKDLHKIIARLKEIKIELSSLTCMKDEKIEQLETLKHKIEANVEKHQSLTNTIYAIKENQRKQAELKNSYSERIANIDYSAIDVEISKYKTLFSYIEKLRGIDTELKRNDEILAHTDKEIDELISQFVEELKNVQLCPTCGQGTEEVCKHNVETIL